MSCTGVGALFSSLLLTALGHRWRVGAAATFGALLFPVALMVFSRAPVYAAAVPALFLVGMGLMLFNAVSNTMLQTASPVRLRGRVMSLRAFVFAGMSPIGAFQIGLVASALGPRTAVAIGAAICLLAALFILWRVPRLRASEDGL
jgi:predicted MFS family arabinose efflux permease